VKGVVSSVCSENNVSVQAFFHRLDELDEQQLARAFGFHLPIADLVALDPGQGPGSGAVRCSARIGAWRIS